MDIVGSLGGARTGLPLSRPFAECFWDGRLAGGDFEGDG